MPSLLPELASLTDYRPWFDRITPWLPAMRLICRRHGLDAGQLTRVAEGSAIVFSAGDAMIKLLPPFWADERALDLSGLRLVSGRLTVATPDVIALGELEGWVYLVTRRLPGQAIKAIWPELAERERLSLCRELGELMAALHRIGPGDLASDWPAFVARQRAGFAQAQIKAGLDAALIPAFEACLEAVLPSLPPDPLPVLLHCDLTSDHLLLLQHQGRWRIEGLIDFGDAMGGCGLYEFAAPCGFLTAHRPDLRRALIAGYGQNVTADQLMAVLLLHRFCNVPWLLSEADLDPTPEAFRACYCDL